MKTLLEEILKLLLPGETVAKGIQRLGGGKKKPPRVRQGRGGRRGKSQTRDMEEPTEEERMEGEKDPQLEGAEKEAEPLDQLISLADQMVALGVYEVYQDTYEKLAYRLRGLTAPPSLDMFADEVEEGKAGEEGRAPRIWRRFYGSTDGRTRTGAELYGPFTMRTDAGMGGSGILCGWSVLPAGQRWAVLQLSSDRLRSVCV
ncbi:unnamed protein product, partial [Staurois parvus]